MFDVVVVQVEVVVVQVQVDVDIVKLVLFFVFFDLLLLVKVYLLVVLIVLDGSDIVWVEFIQQCSYEIGIVVVIVCKKDVEVCCVCVDCLFDLQIGLCMVSDCGGCEQVFGVIVMMLLGVFYCVVEVVVVGVDVMGVEVDLVMICCDVGCDVCQVVMLVCVCYIIWQCQQQVVVVIVSSVDKVECGYVLGELGLDEMLIVCCVVQEVVLVVSCVEIDVIEVVIWVKVDVYVVWYCYDLGDYDEDVLVVGVVVSVLFNLLLLVLLIGG